MKFYAAWYPGDPTYPLHDPDCAMLISVTSVSSRWRFDRLVALPRALLIDSGAFRYALRGEHPTARNSFLAQLRLVEPLLQNAHKDVCVDITLCAADYPILRLNLNNSEREACIEQTLANAAEYRYLARQYLHGARVQLMGVAQGYDLASIGACARELVQLGYEQIGVGSLALLYKPDEIMARVEAVVNAKVGRVHVFGITATRLVPSLRALGVHSLDSSTPPKSAMNNELFYSNPFRRYVVQGDRLRPGTHQRVFLQQPLPCECPVCAPEGGSHPDLMKMGKRQYVYLRTWHNYYHLKRAIEAPRSTP